MSRLSPNTWSAPADHSDAELVQRAAGGDAGAFEILVRRHFALPFTVGLARLNDREAAEELAQEVFLRAHLRLGTLRDGQLFPAWVVRIARNLAADWARSGRRRSMVLPLIPLDETLSHLPDPRQTSPRATAEGLEIGSELERAVEILPARLREVVLLHYLEDLSKSEIARLLGVHPASVTRRLDLALKQLREAMMAVPLNPLQSPDAPIRQVLRPFRKNETAVLKAIGFGTACGALEDSARGAVIQTVAGTPSAIGLGWLPLLPATAVMVKAAVITLLGISAAAALITAQYWDRKGSAPPKSSHLPKPPAPQILDRDSGSRPATQASLPPGAVREVIVATHPVPSRSETTGAATHAAPAAQGGPLKQVSSIEGVTISEETGQPVSGATLQLTPIHGRTAGAPAGKAVSNGDGRFRFEVATGGTYQIVAEKHPLVSGSDEAVPIDSPLPNSVTLKDGDSTGGLQVILRRGWTRTGRVVEEDTGAPLAGVAVAADKALDGSPRETLSAEDGSFRLEGLWVSQVERCTAVLEGWAMVPRSGPPAWLPFQQEKILPLDIKMRREVTNSEISAGRNGI